MSKILYVEDEEDHRIIVSHHLKRAGHLVLLATTTADGLALAKSQSPEVILMDLKFGEDEMAGLEATRRLKADAVLRAIPVIAVSAFNETTRKTEALRAGCDDYFVRPIDYPQLLKRIVNLVAANQTAPPMQPPTQEP